MDLFDLRTDFIKNVLDESNILSNPFDQFRLWFQEVLKSEIGEPNAMILSTVDEYMQPSSRVVLLKELKDDGFVFFTNFQSKKAKDIQENPRCSLNFFWIELERQVRINGYVEKILPEESDSYFSVRPLDSRLGAWASPQSSIIPNRDYLENLMKEYKLYFINKAVNRPPNWGGYIVKPTLFEFWQGRANRLHDRIQYERVGNDWLINRLAP